MYLAHLINGNRRECESIVKAANDDKESVRDIYENLFQQSMYEVGELWEYNRISVAVEHMATAITEHLLSLIYPRLFSSERIGRSAVIACVANEYHQLGGKMVADIFEMNGWDAYFLGANTPAHDLMELIDRKSPELIGLSLSIYFNIENLRMVLDSIHERFPNRPVLVGGQAFRWEETNVLKGYPDVEYIPNLTALEGYLNGR